MPKTRYSLVCRFCQRTISESRSTFKHRYGSHRPVQWGVCGLCEWREVWPFKWMPTLAEYVTYRRGSIRW